MQYIVSPYVQGPAENLGQLYKNRKNTVYWLTDVMSKSEELISYVHQRNNVSSADLFDFSEKSDDIASKSYSFISGYTDKEQMDCFRNRMNKISMVMLLLAKEKALSENNTDVLDKANEELNYLLEEEGISEDDISLDYYSIISGSSTPCSAGSEENF
jgi:hypothetical protein